MNSIDVGIWEERSGKKIEEVKDQGGVYDI